MSGPWDERYEQFKRCLDKVCLAGEGTDRALLFLAVQSALDAHSGLTADDCPTPPEMVLPVVSMGMLLAVMRKFLVCRE
jgi:hypothetical protein